MYSAFGSEITFSSDNPVWYSYDCSNTTPNTYTQDKPPFISAFKYFSYYHAKCFVTMRNIDVSGMSGLANSTSMNMTIDTRGQLITNKLLSSHYNVPCKLFYFNNPTITDGVISQTPQNLASFSCTGTNPGTVQTILIPFNSTVRSTIQSNINSGNTTQAFMIFPLFNATMRSNIDTNNYEYGIEKHLLTFYVKGDGFNCAIIFGSGQCNFLNNPWAANEIAFGKDILGQWFYVVVFFPFPMACYLITRNGVYAGFVGLGIMLVITRIDKVVLEMALTMITIAAAFAFYEVIRKRLFE